MTLPSHRIQNQSQVSSSLKVKEISDAPSRQHEAILALRSCASNSLDLRKKENESVSVLYHSGQFRFLMLISGSAKKVGHLLSDGVTAPSPCDEWSGGGY